jgi:hypothetical protein
MVRSYIKGAVLFVLLALAKPFYGQSDSVATFDGLHVKLLNDYLQFIDSVEKKPILESYFRVRARKHVAIIDFTDGKHFYTIHKKIKVYRSGLRYEKIKWFCVKNGVYKKLYIIKTLGLDYRYIRQYTYNNRMRRTKKIVSVDDNYVKVHVYRPKAARDVKTYLKRESSLPASHQN